MGMRSHEWSVVVEPVRLEGDDPASMRVVVCSDTEATEWRVIVRRMTVTPSELREEDKHVCSCFDRGMADLLADYVASAMYPNG